MAIVIQVGDSLVFRYSDDDSEKQPQEDTRYWDVLLRFVSLFMNNQSNTISNH